MKILFLQYWNDFFGGVETVNDTLIRQFNKDGYDCSILCMWNMGKGETISNINYHKDVIGNKPCRISYKKILNEMLSLKISSFIKDLFFNFSCFLEKKKDFKKMKNKIIELNPDYIIVSNIDLITTVPKAFLKRTVIHMHSGFDFYFEPENRNVLRLAKKYQKKIYKFIWLTPNFMNAAKAAGFSNSTYMWNPVRFKTKKQSKLNSNIITFIGGLRKQKMVNLLADIVNEMKSDYKLEIYGSGDSSNVHTTEKVVLMGTRKNVKKILLDSSIFALTSYYEGFPMVILEAYECGVPVIIYNFGISSNECVVDGKTGFVVDYGNKNEYINKLEMLCNNYKLRKKMGQNAKSYARKFEVSNVCNRWYLLFGGSLNDE